MNKNAAISIVETGDFTSEIRPIIQPVTQSRQIFDIYRLTYECYSTGGYHQPRLDGMWISHPDFDHIAETQILVAELDGEVVGSISITRDGQQGLPADRVFPRTCQLTRAQGQKLGQVWRLLVKESCALKEPIITSLVAESVNHLLSQGIKTGLYFVHEDYSKQCRELLNGITLTSSPCARGLSEARGILMRTELETLTCAVQPHPKKQGVRLFYADDPKPVRGAR